YQAEVLRALDHSGDLGDLAPTPTSIHVEAVAEEVVRVVERDGLSTTVVAEVLRRFIER
ncbi:MAG: hypothetical protein IT379_40455, partial [Deltaproteobacteria bacterium]|nr:hypothetical protein [Deltaproteobacteria bacterium]